MSKYKVGSNQHRIRHKGLKKEVIRDLWILGFAFIFVIAIMNAWRYYARLQYYQWRDANVVAAPCPNFCSLDSRLHQVLAAEPEPTPEPTYQNIIAYIVKTFEPEGKHVVVRAINCFYSESGLRADAENTKNTNGTIDRGVAQINSIHQMSKMDAFNYRKNIDKAYQIYKNRGFSAWYGRGCK